jgi:hypothetical protein
MTDANIRALDGIVVSTGRQASHRLIWHPFRVNRVFSAYTPKRSGSGFRISAETTTCIGKEKTKSPYKTERIRELCRVQSVMHSLDSTIL